MAIILKDAETGAVLNCEELTGREAVAVEMWYDRHYRHWVLYPVSKEGYQLDEARYAFSKAEATETRRDMESELIGKTFD